MNFSNPMLVRCLLSWRIKNPTFKEASNACMHLESLMMSFHTLANNTLLAATANSDTFFHFETHREPASRKGQLSRLSVMIFYCWVGFVTRNQNERLIEDQKGRKDQRQ